MRLEFIGEFKKDALQKFNLEEMNAKEIKAAVDEQYLLAKLILNDLPSNILIGPYHVQVESVRQKLSKKHKQLGEAILELLVQKLRGQGDAACDLCKSISRKLNEKPGTASIFVDFWPRK